jgi:hypothetical protein
MDAVAAKEPNQLTQEEVYDLWGRYGGYLSAVDRSVLNHLLEGMAYAEQEVRDVRAEAGDRLYFAALSSLHKLQARAAAGAPELPPPDATGANVARRKTQQEIVREKLAERREAGRWGELVSRALGKAK